MGRVGRLMGLAAAAMVSAVACTAGSSSDGEESGSCAFLILYQNRTYPDVANVEFTVGEKLGDATRPPCDDTGGQGGAGSPETTETVYEVDGIPPEVAIAVGDAPKEATFVAVYSGSELPPAVMKLIDGS
ncbi:DUF6281 family protein [Streptomyces antibioticus]|uniref:DUF6281 family protein n=1 Tax=Streptomyces antibioticus TaxID=1890 RepID=UPI0033B49385